MTKEGQRFADKQRRRAQDDDAPPPPTVVTSGEFVPKTMLDRLRAYAGERIEKLGRALRASRTEADDLAQAMLAILRLSEPRNCDTYQGRDPLSRHRAHISSVHQYARSALEKAGRLQPKSAAPR